MVTAEKRKDAENDSAIAVFDGIPGVSGLRLDTGFTPTFVEIYTSEGDDNHEHGFWTVGMGNRVAVHIIDAGVADIRLVTDGLIVHHDEDTTWIELEAGVAAIHKTVHVIVHR